MTRGTTELMQQNSERAMQAANLGMNWARELAEQSLNQSKVVLDGLFNVTRKMAEEFDDQTTAIREHSTSLIETTLSNTFDFGHKLARLREPQELVELQSEFVSRQSQAIADQTKELGQKIKNGTTGAAARLSRAA
ncbi:MAG: phasin family protein [Pseudolabrys sp.]